MKSISLARLIDSRDAIKPTETTVPQSRVRIMMPYGIDQFLLEELINDKYPQNLGKTRFPGGGIEPEETPVQAAMRELVEETGQLTDASDYVYVGAIVHHRWGHLEYYLLLRNHGLKPGIYTATVEDADPVIKLIAAKPEGPMYFGADPKDLLKYIQDKGL